MQRTIETSTAILCFTVKRIKFTVSSSFLFISGFEDAHTARAEGDQSRTLGIRLKHSLDFSNVGSISPLRAVAIFPPSDFHKFSRAGGPKGLKREHPPSTERISLTKECGWKDGDRGGLAEREQTHGKKKAKVRLDINRPSHGRTWAVP